MDPEIEALSAGGAGVTEIVDDRVLFVAQRGAGVPVVALHAIGHGSADFLPLVARAPGFRFHLVDWPGHGRSPAGGPVSATAFAALVAGLLPRLGDAPVILLGNSIGGAVALAVAAAHPTRVRALVLCDAGGLARIGPLERAAIGLLRRAFAGGARGAWWFPRLFRAYYRLVLPAAPARRAEIIAASGQTAGLLAEAWASFATAAADLRGLPPTVTAPVWLAWARRDRVIPWRPSRAAAAGFRDAAVTLFRGGHSPFLEDPDAFAAAFVARFAPPSRAP